MKRLGDIVVGAGIEACTLSLQRSRAVSISTGIARPARRQASSTEIPSILGKPISRMDSVVGFTLTRKCPLHRHKARSTT